MQQPSNKDAASYSQLLCVLQSFSASIVNVVFVAMGNDLYNNTATLNKRNPLPLPTHSQLLLLIHIHLAWVLLVLLPKLGATFGNLVRRGLVNSIAAVMNFVASLNLLGFVRVPERSNCSTSVSAIRLVTLRKHPFRNLLMLLLHGLWLASRLHNRWCNHLHHSWNLVGKRHGTLHFGRIHFLIPKSWMTTVVCWFSTNCPNLV